MAKGGEEKREFKIDPEFVTQAVIGGIEALVESHPRFRSHQQALLKHIDKEVVGEYVQQLAEKAKEYNNPREAEAFLYNELAGNAASGKLLDDVGKRLVLRNAWAKDKGRKALGRRVAREIVKGEEYLDSVLSSFRTLYDSITKNDPNFAKRNPEFYQSVATVNDMGFFTTAADLLYESGQMDRERYAVLKQAYAKRAQYAVQGVHHALSAAGGLEKAAAAILAILGIGVILKTNTITGNAIGISSGTSIPAIIWGALVLGAGIWLLARSFRKNKKEKTRKIRILKKLKKKSRKKKR